MTDGIVDAVRIRAILFDVDDTLYDKATGFSDHRNNYGVQQFMVQHLNFPSVESAKMLRDEYFQRYHSTAKALMVAEQEGKFPTGTAKVFDPSDLDEFFATKLDFTLLGEPKQQVAEDLQQLGQRLQIAAFSNGPRKYVQRVLTELRLWDEKLFHEKNLFAVNDTLPYCKPEKEAFDYVLSKLGVAPNECILVEDSMKNIRIAKKLGMKTILVIGNNDKTSDWSAVDNTTDCQLANDLPVSDDPSVDAVIAKIEDLRTSQPSLWENLPFLLTS